MSPRTSSTRCCVVGGGPAGMMLAFLLARAGVDVVVLEKHRDFLRDFRGDTIHPSTLQLMHELGLLSEFLAVPHAKAVVLTARVGQSTLTIADFGHLPTACKFIAFMPQWDFLNFLARQGGRYPAFHLEMEAEATDLIRQGDTVVGVRAKTPSGDLEIRAPLVVGCDGRHSTVRQKADLEVEDLGAPMDVLWFRLSRRTEDQKQTLGNITPGHILITLDRGDYWQCAYVIPKGTIDAVRQRGLQAFRDEVAHCAPMLAERVHELTDWDQVKLLTVCVDRLTRWHRPGLLCIGDAAHAMSPIGGVGINLAIQDAVATANLLAEPLRQGAVGEELLHTVQERREFPTRVTQRIQLFIQDRVITGVLGSATDIKPPLPFRLLQMFPILRRLPARLIGLGVRPEQVQTPERSAL